MGRLNCVWITVSSMQEQGKMHSLFCIEESLDALSGARWFSTLDLASGYHQVEVAEKDRCKTAFCTPFELYEFTRMPLRLCNSPGTFSAVDGADLGESEVPVHAPVFG